MPRPHEHPPGDPLAGGDPRERLQLPGEDVAQVGPVWMPDGRQLLISRTQATRSSVWILAVDGGRAEELFALSQQGSWTIIPSPNGRKLLGG